MAYQWAFIARCNDRRHDSRPAVITSVAFGFEPAGNAPTSDELVQHGRIDR